jgi:hypothetical protein
MVLDDSTGHGAGLRLNRRRIFRVLEFRDECAGTFACGARHSRDAIYQYHGHQSVDGMPLEGGLRLLADGKVIGGIGVSGVQAPQDAQIAKAGADLMQ